MALLGRDQEEAKFCDEGAAAMNNKAGQKVVGTYTSARKFFSNEISIKYNYLHDG